MPHRCRPRVVLIVEAALFSELNTRQVINEIEMSVISQHGKGLLTGECRNSYFILGYGFA